MGKDTTIVLKGLTNTGRVRELNEDSFGTPQVMGIDEATQSRRGVLFAVADGMGGHAAGEVASRMAIETLFKAFYASRASNPGKALREAYAVANRAIYEFASNDPARSNMGTTLVAGVVKDRNLWIANVGDSRAYLVRGAKIKQITQDHSWVADQVRAKVITPEQAQRHVYKNIVTRAVGTHPQVKLDLFHKRLDANDIILLCSDGLSNLVAPGEICAIATSTPDPVQMTEKLIALANERGGDDNITAIAVRIPPSNATKLLFFTSLIVTPLLLLAAGLTWQVVSQPPITATPSATAVMTSPASLTPIPLDTVTLISTPPSATGNSQSETDANPCGCSNLGH